MKPSQKKVLLDWLPVTALGVAIFVQACFPSPDFGPAFPMKDKLLHMAAYGLLAVLFGRACQATWPGRMSPAQLVVVSVLFATLYGLSDELHQAFVPTRQADGYDLLADFAGSILGAMACLPAMFRQGLIGSKEGLDQGR